MEPDLRPLRMADGEATANQACARGQPFLPAHDFHHLLQERLYAAISSRCECLPGRCAFSFILPNPSNRNPSVSGISWLTCIHHTLRGCFLSRSAWSPSTSSGPTRLWLRTLSLRKRLRHRVTEANTVFSSVSSVSGLCVLCGHALCSF